MIIRTRAASRPPAAPFVTAVSGGAAVLTVTAVLGGLALTGQLAAQQLLDPGAVVRYGLPLTRAIQDAAAVATVGLLVVATVVLPDEARDRWALRGLRLRVVRQGGVAAGVWAASQAVLLILSCSDITGVRLTATGFDQQVVFFATHVELGQITLGALLLSVVAAHLALLASRLTTAGWAAVTALLALLPLALGGHASGSNDHVNAVNSIAAHLIGVTVWAGGVLALLLLSGRIHRLDTAAERFSRLALWCFGVVALSGLDNAWVRLGGIGGLRSVYGVLVAAKTVSLLLLGTAGYGHRRVTLPALVRNPRDRARFVRLLGVELLVMGFAIGVAVALSRSAPPVPESVPGGPDSAFRALTGFSPPPPISPSTLVTQWYPDWLLLGLCTALAGGYLLSEARLHRRGESWPLRRTLAWLAGCLLLAWTTSGGPTVYGAISFSGHMVLHLLLLIAVPPLLVLGGPLSLALAALPGRTDSSTGSREWLLAAHESPANRLLATPIVAGTLYSGGLLAFYTTSWFPLAISTHTGHMLMIAYALTTGYLFARLLVGPDPVAGGPPTPAGRVGLLTAAVAAQTLLAAGLLPSTRLLAPDWWPQLGLTEAYPLLADQRHGALVALATAYLVMPIMAVPAVRTFATENRRRRSGSVG